MDKFGILWCEVGRSGDFIDCLISSHFPLAETLLEVGDKPSDRKKAPLGCHRHLRSFPPMIAQLLSAANPPLAL